MITHEHYPDRSTPQMPDDDMIERLVEDRLEQRFEAESFHWRMRLIAIETVMMGLLVLVAGLVLKQPFLTVARAAVLIAGSCLVTGLLLVGLSAAATKVLHRVRGRKPR